MTSLTWLDKSIVTFGHSLNEIKSCLLGFVARVGVLLTVEVVVVVVILVTVVVTAVIVFEVIVSFTPLLTIDCILVVVILLNGLTPVTGIELRDGNEWLPFQLFDVIVCGLNCWFLSEIIGICIWRGEARERWRLNIFHLLNLFHTRLFK